MALTRTLAIYRDTLLAKSGSTPVGGGDDEHLPIGVAGSYDCKAALKFTLDFSGVTKVISARLYLKTTTKVHALTWGGSPTVVIERQTGGNFSENSGRSSYDSPAGSGWVGGASDFDDVPNGSNDISWTVRTSTPAENTWYSCDITSLFNQWVPTNVLLADGVSFGAGQPNYGIDIRPSSYATSETVEFYSRKGGAGAYIVMTYESNTAPNAPTGLTPTGLTVVADQTPDLSFLYDDPQGDVSSKYQVQVATDAGFTAIVDDSGEVASAVADNTTIVRTVATTLTRGTTYYWRAMTWDAAGLASAWSATGTFVINSLPVATLLTPNDATGKLAKMVYTPGAGWANPRMEVSWSYADSQGQAQSDYELEVVTDAAGSPSGAVIASGVVAGAATTVVVAGSFVEDTRYHVRVRVKDGMEWSAWSGYFICRVRWGLDTHRKDVSIAGVAPTAWSVKSFSATVDPTKNAIVIEYNSSDDGTTNLGAVWQTSLATVAKRKWVHYRVWFLAWGASPVTRATFNDITIATSGNVQQPDFWLPVPLSSQKGSLELDDRVFGSLSLRMDGDGSPHYISQQLKVTPNTDYVLQGRVRSVGNSGAKVYLSDTQNGAALTDAAGAPIQTAPITADADWTQLRAPVWNSGARSTVWVHTYINGATGTVGLFDGLKGERGQVASPWVPGLVGTAGTVVDAGGIQVDAATGAIFRLRTSGGNIIELGPDNLYLDGNPIGAGAVPYVDTDPPPSPTDGQLWWDTDDEVTGGANHGHGTSFPSSPTVNDTFYREDIGMSFYWSGTYWLCTCLHEAVQGQGVSGLTTTDIDHNRIAPIVLPSGCTDALFVRWGCGYHVASGTALSASHKWTVSTFANAAAGYGSGGAIYTKVIDSGASATWRRDADVDIAILLSSLTTRQTFFNQQATKTGTPGPLYFYPTINYRYVAT